MDKWAGMIAILMAGLIGAGAITAMVEINTKDIETNRQEIEDVRSVGEEILDLLKKR
jgi:hypothetical protein